MSRETAASVLIGAGLALALAGLAGGALAAFLAAPPAVAMIALAVDLRRRETGRQPRYAVGAGAAALLLSFGLVVTGGLAAALLAAVSGLAAVTAGAQRGLALDPPPAGVAPAPRTAQVTAAAAADELVRLFYLAGALRAPSPGPAAWARDLREAAERHRELGWAEAPERAHPTPPSLEKLSRERLSLGRLGGAETIRFESEFEPVDAEIREAYLDVVPNRTAQVTLWRHPAGSDGEAPRPALIVIHGYGMGRPGLDARFLDVPWLHRTVGVDVAQVTLPLHGVRALARRSGEGFVGGHPLWTNAALGQAVWELRRLTGWLRSQGAPAVGVLGMSLGGYTAALFASVESRLACAVPVVPVASLTDLVLRDLSDEQRLAREALGLTRAVLEDAWAPHAPLRHAPRVAPEGRLIVAGLADRICPPEQAHALWEHWDRPAIHWFPGSHLVPLGRAALRERLAGHLRATLRTASTVPLSRFRT